MDGLLNGTLCQIAGVALEKLRNSPRFSERENIQSKYDLLQAHFQGVSRILKPAIHLLAESRSADRAKSESRPTTSSINYYTPQKQSNNCCCNERYNNQSNLSNEIEFHRNQDFPQEIRNISWKTCDACQAVSKFLIPTSCDHEICQKCVKNGKDCQKCLNSVKTIKRENSDIFSM